MIGLLLKDLYELKKLWIQPRYIIASIITLITGIIFLNSNTILISIALSVFLINTIQTLFVNDRKNGWTEFVQTTAISSNKIISSRYLVTLIVALVTTLLNGIISLILWFIYGHLSLQEYLIVSLIFLIIILIYVFFLLPFFYAFDENGLTIGILIFIALAFTLSKIPGLIINIITFLQSILPIQITFIGIFILILLAVLSFISSMIIFQRKVKED